MRTSFGLRRRGGRTYNVSTKVDVDMLNAVKSVWLTFRALALRQSKDGMNSYYN